jgi:flagellar assembly factor FliW
MVVNSTRFGQLDVPEDEIVRFPDGLPGFTDQTAFAVIPHSPDSPFAFFQSLGEPDLTFLMVNPFFFFADYEFELDDGVALALAIEDQKDVKVYNIVTVPEKTEEMTTNLLAPVVVNWRRRVARQTVLEKTAYTTKHRLFPNGFPKKPAEGDK